MKRQIGLFLAAIMIMSMICTACATENEGVTTEEGGATIATEEISEDATVSEDNTIAISFYNLAAGACRNSSETYAIVKEDTRLNISSCVWSPVTQSVFIGFRNVDTNRIYGCTITGGSVRPISITSAGVPDGEYQIFVKNSGTKPISGTFNYWVSNSN